jgi:DNA-directed RNA polymerase subunit K/omega
MKNMLIDRSNQLNTFEFIVVAALRAKQLARGAAPRVGGDHKPFITAQLEVLAGKVQTIGDTPMPEQSDERPRPASIAAQENVSTSGRRSVMRSVSGLAGTFSK